MVKLRVRLNSASLKQLFSLVKNSPKYKTWVELSKDVGTSSTPLKKFRRGTGTILETAFLKLLGYLDEKDKTDFLSQAEYLDANWGAIKGGIISNSKLSKEELNNRMRKIRLCIKENKQKKQRDFSKLDLPTLENLEICELFGALLGDGCSGKYLTEGKRKRTIYPTQIAGNAIKDFEYVQKLGKIFEKYFGLKPYLRIRKDNCVQLAVRSCVVYEWLVSLGFPVGKKPLNFGLSEQILKLPTKNLNAVIRGLLDTDGHVNARKDEEYRYPYVTITSYSSVLRDQIKSILKRQGFTAFIHAECVSVRGIKNFQRWFELIGSNNSRILNKYKEFCNTGKIIPGLVVYR